MLCNFFNMNKLAKKNNHDLWCYSNCNCMYYWFTVYLTINKNYQDEVTQTEFKMKNNMPSTIRLQQGACFMYLNNSLSKYGILV